MSQSPDRYGDLLKKKSEALQKILEITCAVGFDDEASAEDKAERFVALYERREIIINRIIKIDDELNSPDFDGFIADEAVGEIIAQIKETAHKIVALDERYSKIAEEVSGELKDGIKKMRQGTSIYSAYSEDPNVNSGYSFDTKN